MLSIEELKNLRKGDWVWVVVIEGYNTGAYTGYRQILSNEYNYIQTYDDGLDYAKDYGTRWFMYRNKEEAENRSITIPCIIDHIEKWHDKEFPQKELVYRDKYGMIRTQLYNEDEFEDLEKRWAELTQKVVD